MIPLKDNVPTSRFPVVTVALIVVNVGFFVWQLSFSGDEASQSPQLQQPGLTERDQNSIEYGAIPYRLLNPGEDCAFGGPRPPDEADIVCEGTAGVPTRAEARPARPSSPRRSRPGG